MDEYIKKEDVLSKAQWFEMYDGESEDSEFAMKYIDPDDVESISSADVVEVVHSRWKYFRKQGIAVCMNCSFERKLDENFGRAISCPNCAARMDGE